MVTPDHTGANTRSWRFIGRWLIATWVPPIGIHALVLGAFFGLHSYPLLWISSVVPIAFWLSVSLGEAWALTGIVSRPRQWGTATFLSGFVAMLCLLYASGMFPTFFSPLRVLNFLAIYAGLTPGPTTAKSVLGGGVFGFVIGLVPMACLRSLRSPGLVWIGVCITAGFFSFGWLAPLYWYVRMAIDRFGDGLPSFLFPALLLVTPAMALFMLGWLVYSLLTGLALRVLVDRQARIDGLRISGAFD
jgi:hypothetical protein